MSKFGEWVDRLFNQHKAVRRGLVLWAVCLITFVTLIIFLKFEKITVPIASAYATVTALLTVVLGLYQWSRDKEKK